MTAIVVIAGSAGSFAPLKRIVGAITPDCACTVFVTTHIGSHPSVMPSLLARPGGPPAVFPVDGDPIVGGRIYVAPPDLHMTIGPGIIRLGRGPKVHHTRPAADPLFFTAADHYGHHVMAIVLSGGGGDGAEGLRHVHARGGIALVQKPSEAKQPSMPLRAILADHPDAVLPVEGLVDRVRAFCCDDPRGMGRSSGSPGA
jgi:two-component system chemotaxis response regulator CheB